MHEPSHLLNFVASMPARYAQGFDWLSVEEHAQVVFERGQQPVNIGLFTSLKHGQTGLCVVAPDRPGLLLDICAAFDRYDLDVIEAEIFTRSASPSLNEAVDLFWIRRRPPNQALEVNLDDVGPLREILIPILSGARERATTRHCSCIRTPAASCTTIRFIDDASGGFATLEIQTNDRSGLLLTICQALLSEDVQINGSLVKSQEGRMYGRFDIGELDDSSITPERRQVVQMAVMAAIDELPHSAAPTMLD